MFSKIKRAVRRWLGLGEMFMGVDAGMRDQSCIVIISRLNGGSVRIIDAKFENIRDIERLTKDLQAHYGIPDKQVFKDYPGIKPQSFYK